MNGLNGRSQSEVLEALACSVFGLFVALSKWGESRLVSCTDAWLGPMCVVPFDAMAFILNALIYAFLAMCVLAAIEVAKVVYDSRRERDARGARDSSSQSPPK